MQRKDRVPLFCLSLGHFLQACSLNCLLNRLTVELYELGNVFELVFRVNNQLIDEAVMLRIEKPIAESHCLVDVQADQGIDAVDDFSFKQRKGVLVD